MKKKEVRNLPRAFRLKVEASNNKLLDLNENRRGMDNWSILMMTFIIDR
ncbi:MAG: hypothetical protein CM1200mP40_20200 [Gammaproteobacteria bacterium]|nr:MAG: hypothetical protein CM1200mP40_20200 [Gammaproteobacteria bacterium]